ncbi:MAG TPA: hypothetical protein VL221_12300 [Bacteroidota bacterium]|nr:hypothetical protein [Bacteroidota bacterium]
MKKIFLAGIAGGLLMFIWSTIAWVAIPLHTSTIFSMANEDSVLAVMKSAMDRKGVYMFPARPTAGGDAAMETWKKKFSQGPVGMVIYSPGERDLTKEFLTQAGIGIVDYILVAMLAAWLLSRCTAARAGYFARVMFCGMIGVIICLFVHVFNWTWMYPGDYTTGWILDTLVAWVAGGMGIAFFVKAPA